MGQISHCIQRNIYCNVTCRRLPSVVVFAIALYSCVVELSIIVIVLTIGYSRLLDYVNTTLN